MVVSTLLIHEYRLKGTHLSARNREALNAIGLQSTRRPPKRFDFKCPLKVIGEVMQDVIAMQHNAAYIHS